MKYPTDPDAYVAQFSGEPARRLAILRGMMRTLAPEAAESISYGMLAYKYNEKPLLYFGGFENHIGMYATPNGHEAFEAEFARYKHGKGSVQLPLNEPLPEELIRRVIEFRLAQLS